MITELSEGFIDLQGMILEEDKTVPLIVRFGDAVTELGTADVHPDGTVTIHFNQTGVAIFNPAEPRFSFQVQPRETPTKLDRMGFAVLQVQKPQFDFHLGDLPETESTEEEQ